MSLPVGQVRLLSDGPVAVHDDVPTLLADALDFLESPAQVEDVEVVQRVDRDDQVEGPVLVWQVPCMARPQARLTSSFVFRIAY